MFYIKPEDFTVEKLTARNEVIKDRIEECRAKLEEGAFHPFCSYELEIKLLQEEYQINCETISKLERRDNELKALFMNLMANEISIEMSSANKPPKIKLNGKDIEGIVSLDYKYETLDENSNGQHNFTVKYCDKESHVIRTVSVNKVWEV
ncbi:hypothetical protein C7Y47_22095 [Lysinibacillus sphaericus]|uniref:Uncharacterized protein n=1 Tax=Lysinibacillus sphaericus TaxID=1421 RepID=A0A544U8C3_LYSSH|nr:hypothetical protein [Lysinibacillus sp. SDF0037]TQR28335.1 hypothetical protein C7Y47_22095 [Lysinibacillus sp. SDF0037]